MPDKRDKQTRDYHGEMQRLRGLDGGGGKVQRLSASEVARALLNRQPSASRGSVTLILNAKGDVQIEVALPTADGVSLDATADEAAAVFDKLRERYPRD